MDLWLIGGSQPGPALRLTPVLGACMQRSCSPDSRVFLKLTQPTPPAACLAPTSCAGHSRPRHYQGSALLLMLFSLSTVPFLLLSLEYLHVTMQAQCKYFLWKHSPAFLSLWFFSLSLV